MNLFNEAEKGLGKDHTNNGTTTGTGNEPKTNGTNTTTATTIEVPDTTWTNTKEEEHASDDRTNMQKTGRHFRTKTSNTDSASTTAEKEN